ncbi:class I adenylate-forming enzyme family protein [Pseudoduganella sp. UC29_106]|uniref:class I adenylate-forming enzyme family protein n=1 Tax=Pseudoduganella sp. UC29_106 TaxID=3374553 RepID=UPI003756E540
MSEELRKAGYYRDGYWRHETLWDTLARVAHARAGATAFIDGERTISYEELLRDAGRFAGAMSARRMAPGEAVIIHGRNAIESVTAMLGCWRQGLVAIPVPPMFSAVQLGAIIANAGARVLFSCAEGEALEQAAGAAAASGLPCLVTMQPRSGSVSWKALLEDVAAVPEPAPRAPDAVAMLLYSSGTTGAPKGVIHSANTIRYAAEQVARQHAVNSEDKVLVACQFGFVGSAVLGLLLTLASGATGVIVGRWSAEHALDLIERHRASYSLFMPTHVIDLLSSPRLPLTDCSSLRRAILAGITPEQRSTAAAHLCAQPLPMFGMSESPGQTTCTVDGDADGRDSTDGRAITGAEVRIVDDCGETLPPGETGNVLVRGPSRCLGYFAAPELSDEAIDGEGYFRTGDLGRVDEQGYFTFGSRAKDVIRRGGVTIVPSEIEEALRRQASVRDAAVIGLPDPRLGERICACVVVDGAPPTLESVNAALTRQGLAQYLRPEVLLVFDELPRTASLKVKKADLRDLALRRLG